MKKIIDDPVCYFKNDGDKQSGFDVLDRASKFSKEQYIKFCGPDDPPSCVKIANEDELRKEYLKNSYFPI